MFEKIIKKLKNLNPWHFLWIAVLCSGIFTAIMNSILSLLWWGDVSADLLVIGAIDAFIVSLIAATPVIYFLRQTSKLAETNKRRHNETSEKQRIDEDLRQSQHLLSSILIT